MNVIRLLKDAVFINAGSFVIKPKSSSDALIFRSSMALIVPSAIGTSYCLPVRLSVIVRVSALIAFFSHRLDVSVRRLESRLTPPDDVTQTVSLRRREPGSPAGQPR